jgi:hypothetical protein
MEVWFYPKKEPRPRGQDARRRIRKNLHQRSSEARRESFCPLDKDLSWKSRNRKLAVPGPQSSGNGVTQEFAGLRAANLDNFRIADKPGADWISQHLRVAICQPGGITSSLPLTRTESHTATDDPVRWPDGLKGLSTYPRQEPPSGIFARRVAMARGRRRDTLLPSRTRQRRGPRR